MFSDGKLRERRLVLRGRHHIDVKEIQCGGETLGAGGAPIPKPLFTRALRNRIQDRDIVDRQRRTSDERSEC